MDFVWPLGSGSKLDDAELGWSMRSVRWFVPDAGNLIVIGDRPRTDPGVGFAYLPHVETDVPNVNAKDKMVIACKNRLVSEDFVWMNDDIFFIQPIKAIDLRVAHSGSLASHIEHRAENPDSYYRSLCETQSQLKHLGLTTRDFEVHTPLPVNKQRMEAALNVFKWDDLQAPLLRSCYGNYSKFLVDSCVDLKIGEPLPRAEILRRIGMRAFFSVGDGGFAPPSELRAFLEELAP